MLVEKFHAKEVRRIGTIVELWVCEVNSFGYKIDGNETKEFVVFIWKPIFQYFMKNILMLLFPEGI